MPTDSPSVLIVEDEPDLANLYAAWLGDSCAVETAYDGETALDAIDETVDIVLLDRRMPGLSGDTILTTIRERGLDCRVAMVTAVEPDFDIIEMGFDDYLVKPVSKEELRRIVDQLTLRSSYDEQLQEYARLQDRLAVLRVEVNDTMEELLEQDGYRRLCQDITRDSILQESN